MLRVFVIGGGASGMAAAITAARAGASVTVLEQKERLGKKILSTGNGRCNLTNEYMSLSCFRGEDVSFAGSVLEQFGFAETMEFFKELGVITKSRNGYIYPRSDQASSILEALEMELKRLEVTCYTNTQVTEIIPSKKGFSIQTIIKRPLISGTSVSKGKRKKITEYTTENHIFRADRIILATGGKAASVLGSDGSGYTFAKVFGHSLAPVLPALVQLRSDDPCFKKLLGIRAEGCVKLYVDHELAASDTGEIQLTDYGISGIPVFQVSRYAAMGLYKKQQVTAVIDFFSSVSEVELTKLFLDRREKWSQNNILESLSGIFNSKLIPVLLEKSEIDYSAKTGQISKESYQKLAFTCKNFSVPIRDTNSFEQAQVCAGGVRTSEIDNRTLESKYVKGLYFTGELMDIEGICGGYNLQWAWSTGVLAGKSAAS